MIEECRCCVCDEVVIPEDDETVIDSDGNFYCDLHSHFCCKHEEKENQ